MQKITVQIPSEFKELFTLTWRNIIYYGGRASGKSHSVARALLIRGRQKKLRILCTREYQNSIADSVHKLLKDIIELYGFNDYEIWKDRIINTVTGTEFIFKGLHNNVVEIKSTEGIDICWVEEAQSISEESLRILPPTIRKDSSQMIYTYNRINELDPVHVKYVMNKPAKTYIGRVNYDIIENLGLMPEATKLELEADRANKELFAHVWLGEPIGQAEMSVISRGDVLQAMNRTVEPDGPEQLGVDVARMGNDRTVLWKRKGHKTIDFLELTKLRTTEVCDKVEQFIDFKKDVLIKVDDTGVGGGVTDELIKRGYEVTPINFGQTASEPDKYPNLISEGWFHMAKIISKIELPQNSDLLMELTARRWGQDTKGKRRIESKNEYKKRGFRSPDLADACIIAYYEPNLMSEEDIAL